MKIAILGTRGIPNNYGGFEQFAEILSVELVKKCHDVTVYNPYSHPYKEIIYKGVNIIHKYSPENILGSSANFIYDFLCLKDACDKNFDIILELGYGTVAPSLLFFRPKAKIITNMDGLEWKRSKWSFFTQFLMKQMEKLAVFKSDYLIADNVGIQKYLAQTYNVDTAFIPYSTDIFEDPNEKVLTSYNLTAYKYLLVIARMEPENNIEMIIDGYLKSKLDIPLFIIGNIYTKYGLYLQTKYKQRVLQVKFCNGIYDKNILDNLRYFSYYYIHGHSVGGTNPALLEAMGAQSIIIAHDNAYNKSTMFQQGIFFSSSEELAIRLDRFMSILERDTFIKHNLALIKNNYSKDIIVSQYEKLFQMKCLNIEN